MTSRLHVLVTALLVAAVTGAGVAYSVMRQPCEGPCGAKQASKGKPACCQMPSRSDMQFVSAAAADDAKLPDTPMFGNSPFRNMANPTEKGIPAEWSVEEGKEKNLLWFAQLGNKAYAGPVIADGKVFVGTNNANPRDPNVKGARAVLMAFGAEDGKFLWQIVHDIPTDEVFKEAIPVGLCSTPVVEGKKLWYVTSGCEVVCASTDGKIEWKMDMHKDLKVIPYHLSNCAPLVVGDLVMVVTGNGIDEMKGKVLNPKAPSFLALDKNTGKIAWQSALPGEAILEGQWSNPTLAVVGGKQQVIFPGGDSVLYALEPATGKLIWKFDCLPDRPKEGGDDAPAQNYFIATPVFHDSKVYIGLGVYPEHPKGTKFSHFFCIDATKTGDVSPKSYDAKDPKNKESALVWSFGGMIEPKPKAGQRQIYFGRTISTAALHDGIVYISEEGGYLHCLDAKTGQRYWVHDLKSGVWGSPYYVDGKVMIGNEDGELNVFAAGKEKKVLASIDMGEAMDSTPVAVNGTLYITTRSKLYAIREKK
ncbi:MAG: PQQ-binding-like beta-propeller repeat protein [Gemmataceae bacterium]